MRAPSLPLLLVCLLVALAPANAAAQTLDERFEAANGAYHQGRWDEAIRQYAEIRDQFGACTAALAYNIGTAHARAERPGRAILALERALRLAPSSALAADIEANLAVVRATLAEEHRRSAGEELHSFGNATPVWNRFFQSFEAPLLRWGFAGALALLILVWIGYRTRRSPERPLRAALALSACITLGAGLMTLGNHWTAEQIAVGIVVAPDAWLREGLHEEAGRQSVPEGLSVRILEGSMQRDHLRVQLTNGREGWMAAGDVEEI